MKKIKNALVILAGGKGNRFDQKLPKQFPKHKSGVYKHSKRRERCSKTPKMQFPVTRVLQCF